MERKSASRIVGILGVLLVIFGAAWMAANRRAPDDSLYCGLFFLCAGAAGAAARKNGFVQGFVVTCASIAFIWIIGEAGTRIYIRSYQGNYLGESFREVSNPKIIYEFKPGARYADGTVNSSGFWDREFPEKKPAGVYRIAVLGDSVTAMDEFYKTMYAKQLENMLNACGAPVRYETLNFGVPGYNTIQEVETFRTKALKYDPDMVVLGYVLNDPYPGQALVRMTSGHSKFISNIEQRSRISFLFRRRFGNYVEDSLAAMHSDPEAWDTVVVRGFKELKKLTEDKKIPVVVVIFPLLNSFDSPVSEAIYKKVAAEARRNGFEAIILLPAFKKGHTSKDIIRHPSDIMHPNIIGHKIAGEQIYSRMSKYWKCGSAGR